MGELRRKIRIDIALPIYQSFLGGIFYKGHPLSAQRDEKYIQRDTQTHREIDTQRCRKERERKRRRERT